MKDLRRVVVALVIGSFSIAALLGILALLGGGDFGETEGRVLLTTVIVGVESVAMLCYLAVAGHRLAAVGAAGGVVSLVATGTALWLTWGPEPSFEDGGVWQLLGVTITLAATLAQASLLIAFVRRPGLRVALGLTLLAASVVAAMIIGPILNESDPGGDYWRVFGVVAILDVLGTVVLIALSAFQRVAAAVASAPTPGRSEAPGFARLQSVATSRGTSVEETLVAALDALEREDGRPAR